MDKLDFSTVRSIRIRATLWMAILDVALTWCRLCGWLHRKADNLCGWLARKCQGGDSTDACGEETPRRGVFTRPGRLSTLPGSESEPCLPSD